MFGELVVFYRAAGSKSKRTDGHIISLLPFYVFEDVALIISRGDLEGQCGMVTL